MMERDKMVIVCSKGKIMGTVISFHFSVAPLLSELPKTAPFKQEACQLNQIKVEYNWHDEINGLSVNSIRSGAPVVSQFTT